VQTSQLVVTWTFMKAMFTGHNSFGMLRTANMILTTK